MKLFGSDTHSGMIRNEFQSETFTRLKFVQIKYNLKIIITKKKIQKIFSIFFF